MQPEPHLNIVCFKETPTWAHIPLYRRTYHALWSQFCRSHLRVKYIKKPMGPAFPIGKSTFKPEGKGARVCPYKFSRVIYIGICKRHSRQKSTIKRPSNPSSSSLCISVASYPEAALLNLPSYMQHGTYCLLLFRLGVAHFSMAINTSESVPSSVPTNMVMKRHGTTSKCGTCNICSRAYRVHGRFVSPPTLVHVSTC